MNEEKINTEKENTLEKVQEAFESVEEARSKEGLTSSEKSGLESASVRLRSIERTLIRKKTNELEEALSSDSDDLKELTNKIKQSASELSETAKSLEKVSKLIESLLNNIASATAAGLI